MRLLFLNHNVRGRGTFVRACNLGRELAAAGHEVTLVTTSPAARLRVRADVTGGLRIIETPDLWWGPARTGWDPYNTVRRMRLLRRGAFDLVHAFDSRPVVILPALRVAAATRAPLLMDWADWWGRGGRIQERSGWPVRTLFGPVETWFEEAFRLRAVAATVICHALGERLAGLGFERGRILQLPNGCVAPPAAPARARARAALGIEPATRMIVHVGVITAADLVLLRLALAQARALEPRLHLVMVGATGQPGHELAGDGITHTGFVAEDVLQRWLAAADAGVIPMLDTIGHRGRWPSKASDYMSAGLPIVVTDVGDVARLVAARGIGWVAAPQPAALAEALVCAVSAAAREQRGRAARRMACGELSWRSVAARLDSFYTEVLERWQVAA